MPSIAFVRAVPDSFRNAITMGFKPPLDVPRARQQHAGYRAALAAAGYEVEEIPADENHPDCPFIEDVAVVLGSVAVITRPGAAQRRGEVPAVAARLGALRATEQIEGPGTVDGGDVLVMGRTVYVGRSARTNDAGIAQLRSIAAAAGFEVVAVPVTRVLHLKSAVASLDTETLLVAPRCIDAAPFAGYRLIEKEPSEEHHASVLRLRSGPLLVTTTAPVTVGRLAAAGYETLPIDVSEFQAADGGLTCLSLLLED
jgi:dimethylargininase